MLLKEIKANGFKSFADKTEIDVKEGITGIVGPNGSGKSNVVDAVKWVLGEQSVKALRGNGGMTDVIFTGSKSRIPMTRASVSLTFDNSDHYLNSEFKELEIKRVVYQTGENEYYINNAKVRLKDITDLFLDSGASKESFNIISQGSVADVVNSKPIDRRIIFEEAAGVLKYKKRKEDSLKKLDKTNDNLSKVTLLINELAESVEPLRKQSEVAKKYVTYKDELSSKEIALMTADIKKINDVYEDEKKKKDVLKESIDKIELSNSSDLANLERLKLTSIKLDEEINAKSNELISKEKELANLNAEKQMTLERQKYEVSEDKLNLNIVNLKEETLLIKKNIDTSEEEINLLKNELQALVKIKSNLDSKMLNITHEKYSVNATITNENHEIAALNNKIDIIKDNLENDAKMPYAVKSVLTNPRLKGVYNTIGKLISCNDTYALAIDVILGGNSNVLVVDNEDTAKDCISYLKDNKLGRATFFPLNIIKDRNLEKNDYNLIKDEEGFINIAANLVQYENKYDNIIKNQLGNVVVVKDMTAMNHFGKILNYRYRIVTLDGEVLYTGGAVTGGTIKSSGSTINQKLELSSYQKDLSKLQEMLEKNNREITDILKRESELNFKLADNGNRIIDIRETINRKSISLNDLNSTYDNKIAELNGTLNMQNNSLNKELDFIMTKYYEVNTAKDIISKELDKLKKDKTELQAEIEDKENINHRINSDYNKKTNELKEIEISLGKMDVRLDNLLLSLNENYNMTYEKALMLYDVDIDLDETRSNVNKLKSLIKELGEVNTGSIAEFERVNTRYEYLVKQREDLQQAIDDLMSVIKEMDDIMQDKFVSTFNKVSTEFKDVFRILFKGGTGKLLLTDPNDLLNTGIEIIAEPPGKKLNSIGLLSGGEKTLTAIALLFAILNVKTVPFCILDEVEAALDEANVDAFGKYLQSKKDKSQFIIITHKKKTMEYADTLYGITMQESGVSKLVSVKLED